MSCLVVPRTREFGVRMALGAVARDVVGLVLRQGLRVAAVDALGGASMSLCVALLQRSLLHGVGPADTITLAAVIAKLVLVGLAAEYGPARRATRVDPAATAEYSAGRASQDRGVHETPLASRAPGSARDRFEGPIPAATEATSPLTVLRAD